MKALTIRNVPKRLADALNRERRKKDTSLNSTVLDLLSRGLGVSDSEFPSNGLAHLAGTWSQEELRQFEAAVAPFEAVDDDMWV
jgi:hypothetical protein